MVFILAASSLHHALEILTTGEMCSLKAQFYSISGLSLNTNTETSWTPVENLLYVDLKDKNNVSI